MTCALQGIFDKPQPDKTLFMLPWADFLDMGVGRQVPVMDKIQTSSWAINAGSPSASVILTDQGMDEVSGTTWVSVDGGNVGDVVWIDNTIETRGSCLNGVTTPSQRSTRQIRIRITDC